MDARRWPEVQARLSVWRASPVHFNCSRKDKPMQLTHLNLKDLKPSSVNVRKKDGKAIGICFDPVRSCGRGLLRLPHRTR